MMLRTRYCRRCAAPTEHVEDDQPWSPWHQVLFFLFRPLVWLFPPLVSIPLCATGPTPICAELVAVDAGRMPE
jgi:hypothetical protein